MCELRPIGPLLCSNYILMTMDDPPVLTYLMKITRLPRDVVRIILGYVALQRVKLLMSDLQSALQLVLAECWLTERAASRAALRQRCCLRAW